jgi:cell division protein FtsB
MKKQRKSLMLRLAVCAFAAYLAVTLINQATQIRTRSEQLATLKTQVTQQQKQNTETQRLLSEKDEQFMQSVAENDLGYAKPNERIFVDASGN